MDKEFQDLTPKLHELRYLKGQMPKLKQQGQSKGKKLFVPKGFIDPIPCVICGTTYDRYNHGGEKHELCNECRDKLASGETCLICRVGADGLYDGRHAWVQTDENPLAQKMSGLVIGVDPRTMTAIFLKQKLSELEDGYAIQYCPNCEKEIVGKKVVNAPDSAVLIQCPCMDCTGPENCETLYFDVNMKPVT